MMRRTLSFGLVVLVSACATDSSTSSTTPSEVLQIQTCQAGRTGDSFDLGQPSVHAGELTIPVLVGGGCAPHSFAICWDGQIVDTQPGQVDLVLSHDAHGDHCDAALTPTLRVDLAPVRGAAQPPLIVNVVGAAAQVAGTTNRATIEN